MLVEKCVKFVVDTVEGRTIDFELSHPWRADGKHILQHALRVKSYAKSIIEMDNIKLNDIDEIALPIAIVLHDVGSINGREGHAKKSVELIGHFLDNIIEDTKVKDRIIELILNHGKKKNRTNDLVMNVLIDADLLDELGMQSVMMCSNWIDRSTPFYFLDLQYRIETKEIEFINKIMSITHTNAAKDIIRRKKVFLETVIEQLSFENRGSLDRESVELIKEKKDDF